MIYLMRHGADSPDRLGGWSPFGLSDEGIRQVHTAKEQLRDKGIEAIFTSDLPRSKETVDIVAAYLQLPVTVLPQFRETNNGCLAGMLKTEARETYPGLWWSALNWTQTYPGGESPALFFQRIEKAWRAFRADEGDRTVLLVTHSGVMNVILCLENGISYTNKEMRWQIPDAGIVCLP